MKWLKIIHILLVMMFFGGIMSSFALNLGVNFAIYETTFETYKNIVIISDYIIRIGAVGTLLIGFVYGISTNWGFFKYMEWFKSSQPLCLVCSGETKQKKRPLLDYLLDYLRHLRFTLQEIHSEFMKVSGDYQQTSLL